MTPNEQAMWLDIAEAIEPYCVNGAGFIRDYFEDEDCIGFELSQHGYRILKIRPVNVNAKEEEFIIEEDLRIFNKDKPGYFEGMPIDGAEL